MSSAYSFSGGSLRLKGDASSAIQDGKVSKKHKHKHKSSKATACYLKEKNLIWLVLK